MAKPSWITLVGSGAAIGKGATTRTLKASAHTGRLSRSGSIKGTTSGKATDSVTLSQSGAAEFIRVISTSYSVIALGGTVKITGTSNSPSLKLTNLTNSSLLSNFALKVNGTAYSWNGTSSHKITGDPGASSSYSFEISFNVAENQTESSRSITFSLTDSGGSTPTSGTITITQAAGVKTYGTASAKLSYSTWNIGAAGGTATPSYSFSIPWGWNGVASGGGTINKSNSSHTVSYDYSNSAPSSPYKWTLDKSTGKIVMSSLGKNITSTDKRIYIEITIVVNGQTLTATDYVVQQINKATYALTSAKVTLDDIPASGGSADSPKLTSASGKISYDSGDSETKALTASDVTITLSKTVSGANLGSTVKARTKLDTVSATITWEGSSLTQSLDVYQQANQVTMVSPVNASPHTFTVSKNGGSFSVADSPSQTKYFTSGAVVKITDFAYSFSTVPSYVSIDELALTATVGKNLSGSKRVNAITVTITGEGNNSVDILINFSQESLAVPTWNLGDTETFDKDSTGITVTISDPDGFGYKITVSETWMEYSNDKIICRPNLTGLSRTGTVQLVSSDEKTVYATCTITQKSKALPSWDVPSTFRFDSLGQSDLYPGGLELKITDPDSVGWTIDGPSYVEVAYRDGDDTLKYSSLPYSSVGDSNISYLTPGLNSETSERSFYLILKNAFTGDLIATCKCTQDASEAVNNITLKVALNEADSVLDISNGKPDILISPLTKYAEVKTNGITLGAISSLDSEYVYIDCPKSNIESLQSKLNNDWKRYPFLHLFVLSGSTFSDTVFNNETQESSDYYNNEDFLLCEIGKVASGIQTKVNEATSSLGAIVLESDSILEEYQTRYHVYFNADINGESKLPIYGSSDFSESDQMALFWIIRQGQSSGDDYLPIYPYSEIIPDDLSLMTSLVISKVIPMPSGMLITRNLYFATSYVASECRIGSCAINFKAGKINITGKELSIPSSTLEDPPITVEGASGVEIESGNANLTSYLDSGYDLEITLTSKDYFIELV